MRCGLPLMGRVNPSHRQQETTVRSPPIPPRPRRAKTRQDATSQDIARHRKTSPDKSGHIGPGHVSKRPTTAPRDLPQRRPRRPKSSFSHGKTYTFDMTAFLDSDGFGRLPTPREIAPARPRGPQVGLQTAPRRPPRPPRGPQERPKTRPKSTKPNKARPPFGSWRL